MNNNNVSTIRVGGTYHLSCFYCKGEATYQANEGKIVAHNKAFSQLHQNCHVAPFTTSAPTNAPIPLTVEVLPEDVFVLWQCAGCGKASYSIDERIPMFRPNVATHQLQRYCHTECLPKAQKRGYEAGRHRIIQMSEHGWLYFWMGVEVRVKSYREAKLRLEALP